MTHEKLIMEKLDAIKSELDFIKRRVVDIDLVVTDDDVEDIRAAERDLGSGKAKRIN